LDPENAKKHLSSLEVFLTPNKTLFSKIKKKNKTPLCLS